MSEYQYYQFVAVDRPLDPRQMRELRELSSRAQITPTRFVNEYHWGDFRGDRRRLMSDYFDAHLYLASWGTHRVMLRLPRTLLDPATAEQYCVGEAASVWATDTHVILDLASEDEDGDWDADGEGWLASIIPVRAELASGDLRALYLAWLACVQAEELDEDDLEPLIPPNLGTLTAPLQGLADFLRIDGDLLAAAAAASPGAAVPADGTDAALAAWIEHLPAADKNRLLLGVASGNGPLVGIELLRWFRRDSAAAGPAESERRSVGALLGAAEAVRTRRERREARRRAEAAARRQREEVAAQEARLNALAPREEAAGNEVAALIDSKKPAAYDTAIRLLQDLRALSARDRRSEAFDRRLQQLRETHARKYSLLERLDQAGL